VKPLIEDFDKVLVVEGYSDLRFYAEILEYVGLGNQVFIQEITNRAGLTVSLETLLKPDILATKRMIGVIVDADNAPSRNAQRLEASLTQICGQTVSTGQWSSKTPRIGLWLAPGGGVAGEIETSCGDHGRTTRRIRKQSSVSKTTLLACDRLELSRGAPTKDW